VATAPATELAHLDPVRIVAPVLVRLVIAPLAVFASERNRDSDVSASHLTSERMPVSAGFGGQNILAAPTLTRIRYRPQAASKETPRLASAVPKE
jgi:hypothetical protein